MRGLDGKVRREARKAFITCISETRTLNQQLFYPGSLISDRGAEIPFFLSFIFEEEAMGNTRENHYCVTWSKLFNLS